MKRLVILARYYSLFVLYRKWDDAVGIAERIRVRGYLPIGTLIQTEYYFYVFLSSSALISTDTPLEQVLLRQAGEEGYSGGFVEYYIVPLIYPDARSDFFLKAGMFLLVINLVLYGLLIVRMRFKRST